MITPLSAQLGDASLEVRTDLYRSMGKVAYRRETDREIIQVSARRRAVDLERVGGATPQGTPRRFPQLSRPITIESGDLELPS